MRAPLLFSTWTCVPGFCVALMVLCSMQAAAGTEQILHDFSSQRQGAWPYALVADSAGNIYGTTKEGGDYNLGTVYEFSPSTIGRGTESVLHSFAGGADGSEPLAIALDPEGNIYGMSDYGGACTNYECAAVFKLARNSSGQWVKSVIYRFPSSLGYANTTLLVYNAGNLYGSVSYSSNGGFVSVFELTPAGGTWTETTLYTFSEGPTNNYTINALAFDDAGNVYGTLSGSASAIYGLVFELTPSSSPNWTEQTLHTFTGGASGSIPTGPLLISERSLFGTTLNGGEATCNSRVGCGVVYELSKGSGGQWTETVIFKFRGDNVDSPSSPSLGGFDDNGNLYGSSLTSGAGTCGQCGSVFELTLASGGKWEETTLWAFSYQQQPSVYYPEAVAVTAAGNVYGVAGAPQGFYYVQGAIFELTPGSAADGSWKFNPHVFPFTDGQWPSGGLAADGAGNLYGTTQYGGSNNAGSVFEMSPADQGWKETEIYSFGPGSDDYYTAGPSPLTPDGQGNFYGTTELGGAYQAGSVFEISPKAGGGWQETDVFSFHEVATEPVGGVVFDSRGNMYGVTNRGGIYGPGSVFELRRTAEGVWKAATIYSFAGYPLDGANPMAGLALDSAGNLFGTTEYGGAGHCLHNSEPVGCGTVFELSHTGAEGWKETLLHSFAGTPGDDGAEPSASLILDHSGNLYGTTLYGGLSKFECNYAGGKGCGTVFEVSPSDGGWKETVVHEFSGGKLDGSYPEGPLMQGQLGDLYGVAGNAARYDFGALFKLTPASGGGWTESLPHIFGKSESDGRFPAGALIFDASGNLYGETIGGGVAGGALNNGQGTVFEIKP